MSGCARTQNSPQQLLPKMLPPKFCLRRTFLAAAAENIVAALSFPPGPPEFPRILEDILRPSPTFFVAPSEFSRACFDAPEYSRALLGVAGRSPLFLDMPPGVSRTFPQNFLEQLRALPGNSGRSRRLPATPGHSRTLIGSPGNPARAPKAARATPEVVELDDGRLRHSVLPERLRSSLFTQKTRAAQNQHMPTRDGTPRRSVGHRWSPGGRRHTAGGPATRP